MQSRLQQLHGSRILKPRGLREQMATTSIAHLSRFSSSSLRFSSPLFHPLSASLSVAQFSNVLRLRARSTAAKPIAMCKMNDADLISQLELGKPLQNRKPEKRVNGIFWIILLNIGVYVADHIFQVRSIGNLYLYHNRPAWYQFFTATFCHANWNHLSSNLFFLYIFGKLVEEEEGNFALWLSYILTGVGANIVSWLILPRNAVSVGASGAVFGLFTISVLVKMSWDWRKILEVLILGQFVIEKNVNHVAHLSGALVGVVLVWLLSRIPSQPPGDQDASTLHRKVR
ncbi:Rhomboid-like protein 11, chloroplastic, partial [Cucurbita argyrosperma subsp. sororia]